jgi:hypothetical protein
METALLNQFIDACVNANATAAILKKEATALQASDFL